MSNTIEKTHISKVDNRFYRQAHFLISAGKAKQFPQGGIEVAFSGRSNAGKSSAINTLCDNKGLARTSKTPGRTRLVNFFELDEQRRLVDLPGYGFAKVPIAMKNEWEKLMTQYLSDQQALKGLVVIMDIRHPLNDYDWQMLEWCDHYQLPAHVLLTKADKIKRGAQQNSKLKTQKQLKDAGIDASVQIFSALKKTGLDELVFKLNDWLDLG
ncbi:MAG: ribosome biogenesis GTP-binding protein YihA/YsxC [Gammaproteobacteria bacterium]|nr:ribosome biogenesis GTP-binding protein YihA/YsxC [Gammaproteobacteria bacterium]NNJ48811.1 YihA family ribosome biogenesis GTP-binding protein [Gammaproteobacteria bacterium]